MKKKKRKLKKGETGRCEDCGGDSVARIDPYAEDLKNDQTLHLLCDACCKERAAEL